MNCKTRNILLLLDQCSVHNESCLRVIYVCAAFISKRYQIQASTSSRNNLLSEMCLPEMSSACLVARMETICLQRILGSGMSWML
jgi:hypothetical protein